MKIGRAGPVVASLAQRLTLKVLLKPIILRFSADRLRQRFEVRLRNYNILSVWWIVFAGRVFDDRLTVGVCSINFPSHDEFSMA